MPAKELPFPILRETLIQYLKQFEIIKDLHIKHRRKTGEIIPFSKMSNFLNVANEVLISAKENNFKVGLVKDSEFDADGHFARRASWPKYERFLKNNNICYSFYDIHTSKWQYEADGYDIIIWHPKSSPDYLPEAKSKIYFLEKYLKKICFPSYEELWSYEDKVQALFLYNVFDLPAIPTFATYSRNEALEFINKTEYPVVSKIATGSASCGVVKLNDKRSAGRYVRACFSKVGRETYWHFVRQINYVYFQKFISDANYDLRIIVVGNKLFGYYRYPKAGDFKASGAGIIEKKELPEEAMRLALKTKELFKTISLAVDMLYSEKEKQYLIIETSLFCGIDTAEQLIIDGKAGYYEYKDDKFTFREGRYWVQELALQEFFSIVVEA